MDGVDTSFETEVDIRGGHGPAEVLLPIRYEHVRGSAIDYRDVLMAGTADQSLPQSMANAGAAPTTPGALLQCSPCSSIQTATSAVEPQATLPSPEESPSEDEGQQGKNELGKDLAELVGDIVSVAVIAEEHIRRQVDEAVKDTTISLIDEMTQEEEQHRYIVNEAVKNLVSSVIDAVVVAAEERNREHEASVAVEDIFGGILNVAAETLDADAMGWTLADPQDDGDKDIVLVTGPLELEGDKESGTDVPVTGQLDGAGETSGSGATSDEVSQPSRQSKTTGSGTAWVPMASGVVGTPRPRPQTEEMPLGPMTRAQRRLMAWNGDVEV